MPSRFQPVTAAPAYSISRHFSTCTALLSMLAKVEFSKMHLLFGRGHMLCAMFLYILSRPILSTQIVVESSFKNKSSFRKRECLFCKIVSALNSACTWCTCCRPSKSVDQAMAVFEWLWCVLQFLMAWSTLPLMSGSRTRAPWPQLASATMPRWSNSTPYVLFVCQFFVNNNVLLTSIRASLQ